MQPCEAGSSGTFWAPWMAIPKLKYIGFHIVPRALSLAPVRWRSYVNTPPGVFETPHSPRLSGSRPSSLPCSPGLIVTSSHHFSPVPLDMCEISAGLSSRKKMTTCSGR